MSVRAKFKVDSVTDENDGKRIQLSPVYDSDPNSENGRFYRWTPGGQIVLNTVNAAAAEQFRVGEEVYVDFTPAVAGPVTLTV